MILKENLVFLSERVREILKNREEESLEYRLNKDNIRVPFYKKVSLHSLYNPFGENKNLEYKKNTLVISIGFGAGYHLVSLFEKYNNIIVILFEFEIFKSIISEIDLTKLFDPKKLKIITMEDVLDYYDFFSYDGYQLVYPLSYERIFSGILLDEIKKIKCILNNRILDINTQKKFGKIWHKNILKNIKNIDEFDNSPLKIDKPILITGAGYSLIENIELIKNIRDSIYIAATDTSLKILDSYNITPDSVFTFDCQNWTLHHFLSLKSYNFRLFIDFTVNIFYEKIERKTLLFSNHPFSKFFTQFRDRPRLDSSSGNIGTATIDFFYKYFIDIPIITCGIDYAIYNFNMYPKLTSIVINNKIKSNFFNTTENCDTKILYNYNIIEKSGNWCTNSLLKSYSDFCKRIPYIDKIFTLSNSPFTNFKKIYDIKNFFDKISIKEKILYFPELNFQTRDIKKFLENNIDSLMPYFLAMKKNPQDPLIRNLIDSSIDFLMQK